MYLQKLLHHGALVGEIQELFVDKSLRGQGIGAQMVDYARLFAKRSGCVLLEVASNRRRKRTHRFYEQQGFRKSHYKFTYEL